MNTPTIKRILVNLGLVLLIVFPIWYGLDWLLTRTAAGPQVDQDWRGGVVFIFLYMAPLLLAGALVQQLLLLGVPVTWPRVRQRVTAVLSAAVIPAVIVLLELSFGYRPQSVGAMIPGLLLYGLLHRLEGHGRTEAPS